MRQAAGRTAAHTGTTLRQSNSGTRRGLFEIGLALFGLLFPHRFYRRRHGTAAIFSERFTRQNDIVFGLVHGSAGHTIIGTAVVVAASIAITLRRSVF